MDTNLYWYKEQSDALSKYIGHYLDRQPISDFIRDEIKRKIRKITLEYFMSNFGYYEDDNMGD